MDRVSAAKVLVVENEDAPALDLLTALGRRGIGAAWLRGGKDDGPLTPLRGVRIVFLDLILDNFPNDTDGVVGLLLERLEGMLADETHPIAIVVWSTRSDAEEIVELLEESWSSTFKFIAHKFVLLEKQGQTSDDLLKLLPERFAELGAINLLLHWEQLVSDAASDTTTALDEVRRDSDTELEDVLGRLYGAAKPPGPDAEPADVLSAVGEALNVVLEDRILRRTHENAAAAGDAALRVAEGLLQAGPTPKAADRQAQLNRLLLLAPVRDHFVGPRPGNLYFEGADSGETFPISDKEGALIDRADLLRHTFKLTENTPKEKMAEVLEQARSLLLEITPACDYAQDRMRRARLIAGAAVPAAMGKGLGEWTYCTRPVRLDEDLLPGAGDVVLVFNALMWLGLPLAALEGMREIYRLRQQQLNDVQAWFGHHAIRPGVLQIDR